QVGRLGALIVHGAGTRALPSPTVGELVFLPDPASRPGTTLLPVCLARASRGLPPCVLESFFERLHGLGVLLVGLRTGAEMREAQVFEGTIDGVIRYRDAELLVQPHDQIAGPPPHHAMDRRDRAFLRNPTEECPVRSIALGRNSRRR